jgi:hypothetical protein
MVDNREALKIALLPSAILIRRPPQEEALK